MNPNKSHGSAPVTTIVYRTEQDVIDHVIFPAIKDAGKDPVHYNVKAFAKDWVVNVDSIALHGYFNTAPDIAGIIEEYSTAIQAQDLKVGDVIIDGRYRRTVLAKSSVFKCGGDDCVVLVFTDRHDSRWPTPHTVESSHKYVTVN